MKKVLFTLLFSTVLLAANTFAQQYFVYDGDEFSVLLTTDSDNSYVEAVSFSYDGEWVDFNLLDYEDFEDTEEGGFQFACEDGVGDIYIVDYYRDYDYITVESEDGSESWTLYRRE